MAKSFEENAFEEIVKELKAKYHVNLDPAVTEAIIKVVRRELNDLAKKKKLSTIEGVQAYFKKVYPQVWYFREPLESVKKLIMKTAKDNHFEVPSNVEKELNRLYTSLTADTLFAAGAFVVLTRERKRNPITLDDVELVCKDFLLMPKPTWLC